MKWIPDSPNNGTLEVNTDNNNNNTILDVTCTSSGVPFAVCLPSDGPPRIAYFQIGILEKDRHTSISTGWTTTDDFKGGWKTRAMFFNGNLTNGSASRSTSWGPRPQTGQTIGTLLEQDHDNGSTVWYFVDGVCLGKAFALSNVNMDNDQQTFIPCIQVSGGNAKLSIRTVLSTSHDGIPATALTRPIKTGISDTWEAVSVNMTADSNVTSLPELRLDSVTLHINNQDRRNDHDGAAGTAALSLSVQVSNSMSTSAKVLDQTENSWTVQVGGVGWTRRMPRMDLRSTETFFGKQLLPNIERIVIEKDSTNGQQDRLITRCSNGIECTWTRKQIVVECLSSY